MYKVLLPGEALIDKFVISKKETLKAGGAPANVAAAITKLGVESYFVGTVGNDEHGSLLEKTMLDNGINTKGLIKLNKPTTIANVTVDSNGERSFKFKRGADELLSIDLIPKDIIGDYQILHLGSATAIMGGDLWDTYEKLLNYSQDKIIIFDPNYRNALYDDKKNLFIFRSKQLISKSDIVKVSKEELELITGAKDIETGSQELLKIGAKIILVTLGKEGAFFLSNTFNQKIPSIKVKQVDTTGAGDSFIGYLIGQIACDELSKQDLDSEVMLKYIRKANICASITVTKYGALESIPLKEEVERVYKENDEIKTII